MEEKNVETITQNTEPKKLSRKDKRKASQINGKLIDILGSFYSKISTKQLSDSELKSTFAAHNKAWVKVCVKNGLGDEAKSLFALEVKQTWEKKKAKAEAKSE